jgi:hypothetical protein
MKTMQEFSFQSLDSSATGTAYRAFQVMRLVHPCRGTEGVGHRAMVTEPLSIPKGLTTEELLLALANLLLHELASHLALIKKPQEGVRKLARRR